MPKIRVYTFWSKFIKESEYKEVLSGISDRLLIGINNRNLNNLDVDIDVTKRLLQSYKKGKNVVISESGISNSKQIGESDSQ